MTELNAIKNKALQKILKMVTSKIPINEEDAKTLLATNDILEVGIIADYLK